MAKDYIEKRGEGYYVIGKRVSLDSIVHCFLQGDSPETIVESFSEVTLEEVYGALAFYLANRPEIDAHLTEGEHKYEERCARFLGPKTPSSTAGSNKLSAVLNCKSANEGAVSGRRQP
jgi:uncharacterized protein (DUF433 family)